MSISPSIKKSLVLYLKHFRLFESRLMNKIVEKLDDVISSSAEKLNEITEGEGRLPYASGKWTRKEVLGHLIDSAANNHRRFVLAQLKDDLLFEGYSQDDWVNVQKYSDESWDGLIKLWKAYNAHILHLIKAIPENILRKKESTHNLHEIAWKDFRRDIPASFEELIDDYIDHMQHHMNQIFSQQAN